MDLKTYYRKLREISATLPEEVVLVSKATPEGGREGQLTEAPRFVAARLIAEGVAEQASETETKTFRQQIRDNQLEETGRRAAANIQVNVITEGQARAIRGKSITRSIPGAKPERS